MDACLMCIVSWIVYFIPSLIAMSKSKRNTLAIFALNILLGWTILGWVIALIWALTHDVGCENKGK